MPSECDNCPIYKRYLSLCQFVINLYGTRLTEREQIEMIEKELDRGLDEHK